MVPTKEFAKKFFMATTLLEQPLEQLIKEHHPNCLIFGFFFPWASEVTVKLGIPGLVFHGINFFALCTSTCLITYEPYNKVSSELETFVAPNLPEKITRSQLPFYVKEDTKSTTFARQAEESKVTSYGVIVNNLLLDMIYNFICGPIYIIIIIYYRLS